MNKPYRDNKSHSKKRHARKTDLSDTNHIPYAPNLRADAAWVLFQVLENGVSTSELMPKVWDRQSKPNDRAWLQEVVYGCLRNLPKLQIWLRGLLNSPLKKHQKIIEHLIMIGLYQLAFTRTADHAAISETVDACKRMNEVSLSGLVNAVLRRFQRDDIENMPIDAPHAQVGLPKWLHKALLEHYPDQVDEIAHNLQQRADIWLRVNPLKTSLNEYCDLLEQQNYEFEHAGKYSIKLKRAGEISLLPGYQEGFFAVQDYAAQQAATLLAPEKGDIVLDCCAAPGGKTASLLEYQSELGALYALDLVPKRVARIVENLARLGHDTQFADKLKIVTADASQLSDNDELPMFDKILLDAPCSATGVIRRHPDIMWLRKMADIEVLVELQTQILEEAWAKLKVGGVLLYATCSILPKENDQQIRQFLANHDNAKLDEITTTQGKKVSTWQILPGQENMDGFFYARLLKC